MIDPALTASATRSWVSPCIVFVAALLLYSINLNRPPHPDELHHVLAAQHLLETGRPAIADGEYVRGILHTWMVALSYKVFGESLASARFPAVFFVALVVPLLFVWVRREAGRLAAWIAAILFLTSPFAVEIAQFSRFYALQIFSFTAGSMWMYYALSAGQTARHAASLVIGALGLFALAIWLQVTTLMGLCGVAVWLAGAVAMRFLLPRNLDAATRNRRFIAGLIVAVVLLITALLILSKIPWVVERYRYAPLFASKSADEFWYYHLQFHLLYPTLWTLVGVLAIAAVIRSPRLGWFAIAVFGVSFVLASFAGQKETRYFCFAQPFLAILWGLGLSYALPALTGVLQSARSALRQSILSESSGADLASRALLFLALAILVMMNPFWLRTGAIIGNVALPMETPTTDWRAARDVLSPWFADSEIVVTTEELGAIYFLGRSDVRFSPNKIQEIPPDQQHEFGIDPRLGRPLIAKPESLEKLMTCFRSGIVVGPIEHWGHPNLISEPVQAVIRAHARPIEVPKKSHLYAWGWTHQDDGERPDYCTGLDRFSGLRAAQ